MSSDLTGRCVDELLIAGLADYVHMGEVAWCAQSVAGGIGPALLKQTSLLVIERVLRQDLMRAGSLATPTFVAWTGSIEEALERIDREWPEDRSPSFGDICWFENTEKGTSLAERVWAEDCRARERLANALLARVPKAAQGSLLDSLQHLSNLIPAELTDGSPPPESLTQMFEVLGEEYDRGDPRMQELIVRLFLTPLSSASVPRTLLTPSLAHRLGWIRGLTDTPAA
jgi:hypothetical protein